MNTYAIVVFWSSEDQRWVADVPDLWPCSALGKTPEDAVREVRIAMEGVLAVMEENNNPIPAPVFRPQTQRLVS